MVQSRRFRVTLFHHEQKPPQAEGLRYFCCQQEKCPDTDRLHWQMYVETESKISPTGKKKTDGLANLLKRVWAQTRDEGHKETGIDVRVADFPVEAKRYTTLNDKGSAVAGTWFEVGTQLRTAADPQDIATMVLGGQSALEVVQANPANLMYLRSAMTLQAMLPPSFDERDVHIHHIWGCSGSGKSYRAREIMRSYGMTRTLSCGYTKPYFLGDIGNAECIYLEDMEPTDIPHKELLRLTDRYVYNARVLYGTTPIIAKVIIISSNDSPDMFDKQPHFAYRRRLQDWGTVHHLAERYVHPTQNK